jgi:hypothetical protein
MSSLVRRIQLRILRERKRIPQRHKAINKLRGTPYRNCLITKRTPNGEILEWKRYH